MKCQTIIFLIYSFFSTTNCRQTYDPWNFSKCPEGMIPVNKPEGEVCMPDMSFRWNGDQESRHSSRFGAETTSPHTNGYNWPDSLSNRNDPWGFPSSESEGKSIPRKNMFASDRSHKTTSSRPSYSRTRPKYEDTAKVGYLPTAESELTDHERECLESHRVFWPYDGSCYTLLEQGPCSENEWLVLKDVDGYFISKVRIMCEPFPCPCRAEDPDFCEVAVRKLSIDNEPGCSIRDRCRVALAAEQEGLCNRGEQLFLTPFGDGICGCRKDPLHITWRGDSQCYPLFSRGPCPENFTLQFSNRLMEPICTPTLCPTGLVLNHNDGQCYKLYTRGPCDEFSIFKPDETTKEAACQPVEHGIKRIFDIIPGDVINEIKNSHNQANKVIRAEPDTCQEVSRSGKCKFKDATSSTSSRLPYATPNSDSFRSNSSSTKAGKYLKWLLSFRNHHQF